MTQLLGWSIFGIIWGFTILGIILNAIDLKKYKKFSMICYLIMGWCIIFEMPVLLNLIGLTGCGLLLFGGIVYTIGAVLYGVRKKMQIHAFNISSMYICRKSIAIFMYFIICNVN